MGRYDDIWASYMAQRIMRTLGYHVYYGRPFVWQERNTHNLWQNLKDEVFGMQYTTTFCNDLIEAKVESGSVIEKIERMYACLKTKNYLPSIVYELGMAWCEDIKKIGRTCEQHPIC